MTFSSISALSPLDGRYAAKLAPLRPLMSEQGYMHRRVQVEVAWFINLSDAGFTEFKPLSPVHALTCWVWSRISPKPMRAAIKEIEKTTNHDVKAVEYWIKSKFESRPELLKAASEFVHFRLHQRRHQQHQPCPATQGCPRRGGAARAGRG
jgi:adenylosuccinate lyase